MRKSYRMIIVDDEEMLIRLIKKLGRFEELGIEIVDECRDGEDACQSILTHRPDFVLTDIQMPSLDGLEMIGRVQREAPEILFVLISGYRYFEYARSAIQLSVVDYLLKPVDEGQLNALLERLCRMTDERRSQKQDRESLRSFRDSFARERYDAFWSRLLDPQSQWELAELQPKAIQESYGLELSRVCFRILLLNYNLTQVSESGRLSFVDKLNEAARNAFSDKALFDAYARDDNYALLLNFDEGSLNALRTAISLFFYGCKDLHGVFGDFRLTLGLSEVKRSMAELPRAMEEASDAAWGWLYFNGDQIIRFDQVRDMPHISLEAVFPEKQRRRLQDCVRYLNCEELDAVFAGMKRAVDGADYLYPGDLRRLNMEIRAQLELGAVDEERESLKEAWDAAVKGAWEPAQLLQNGCEEIRSYMQRQQRRMESAGRIPVRRALEYIHRNYAQSISLESAADAAGISPAYLSKMFKEINGVGFNDYLTNVRMEESKKLLSETAMSIRDVAAGVGYGDEKYYSKQFKKLFGIKPTEYRKLYG